MDAFGRVARPGATRNPGSQHRVRDSARHAKTHGIKAFRHPVVGPLTLRFETLGLPGDQQSLITYLPVDAESPRRCASWRPGRKGTRLPNVVPHSSTRRSADPILTLRRQVSADCPVPLHPSNTDWSSTIPISNASGSLVSSSSASSIWLRCSPTTSP
ncbi:hypothetical protein FRAHR75_120017 [Frankia sp. Hr75.2]|nr:hypothetical protein FRAHR75_120017 [Frankia sp. Hr75.2]